jgi:hypothetical protein
MDLNATSLKPSLNEAAATAEQRRLSAINFDVHRRRRRAQLRRYGIPDADLRLAISRAVAIETPRGWRIGKDKQTHKIDIVIALAMAAHAAVQGQNEYTSLVGLR